MQFAKKFTPAVHLNLNVRGLAQSATLAINERSKQLLHEGRPIFRLGLGQSPFPVPESVVEELKANAYQKDYLPVKGLRELRAAVADYYRRTQRLERADEDVLIGPGCRVAPGHCWPGAPTDPYVHALVHTVPQKKGSLRWGLYGVDYAGWRQRIPFQQAFETLPRYRFPPASPGKPLTPDLRHPMLKPGQRRAIAGDAVVGVVPP